MDQGEPWSMENDDLADQRPYLVFDNHPSHKSNSTIAFIEDYFKPLALPTYSCEFNSIETLWSHIKAIFKKEIAHLNYVIDSPDELRRYVLNIAREYPTMKARRVSNANMDFV